MQLISGALSQGVDGEVKRFVGYWNERYATGSIACVLKNIGVTRDRAASLLALRSRVSWVEDLLTDRSPHYSRLMTSEPRCIPLLVISLCGSDRLDTVT